MTNCTHRPKCLPTVTNWGCGQRTRIEDARNSGLITAQQASALAVKLSLVLTKVSTVYKGELPNTDPFQDSLL